MNFNEKNIKLKEDNNFDEFYNLNHKLIYYMMNKYKQNGIEQDELEQLSMITMWKCFTNWDVKKSKFTTYYMYCMENEIRMLYRKNTSTKVIPKQLNTSLEQKLSNETELLTYKDIIEDVSSSMENAIGTKIVIKDFINNIEDERKKKVLYLYMKGYNQKDISEYSKYSQAYVSRILKGFLKEIREEINKD